MSKAFTKEDEGGDVYDDLPDKPVSSNNLVTPRGLELIEQELETLHEAHATALDADDRPLLAKINRDLRYWKARRAAAQVTEPPAEKDVVRFGCKVTIEREDGRQQVFTIVGEDEADPSKGTLSYVSPLAQGLMGKSVGDLVTAGPGEVEIIAID
ncbi:transcription elongation factor GreA [Methyloligella sp. 2.7D]|uniref:transcription elongation factor GreA n=1 Tax=unclassified Methyloligella TaxID=2625955 RepID=UPI00157E07B2|nr:transcription elongation factor GreA [Methyloligella sp. GL2]QKP76988.1 transcription elongation factor GreA [Methyloligella sp. GL2]